MESIIVAIRLALRRAWRGLLGIIDRTGLASMPPVATILMALFIGVAVPMALGVDRRPAKLSESLARTRLESFAKQAMPAVSPDGGIYSVRPVFVWKAPAGAARYRFNLKDGNVLMHFTDKVRTEDGSDWVFYPLPAPGYLVPGRDYSFSVEAEGADGRPMGPIATAAFFVQDQPQDLTDLRAQALNNLDPADAAFVLAGRYADLDSVHDVRTALMRFLDGSGNHPDAPMARAILGLPAK